MPARKVGTVAKKRLVQWLRVNHNNDNTTSTGSSSSNENNDGLLLHVGEDLLLHHNICTSQEKNTGRICRKIRRLKNISGVAIGMWRNGWLPVLKGPKFNNTMLVKERFAENKGKELSWGQANYQ
ncbi:hypothetical protein Tco_1449961 [Tanacetum coccineum]